MELTLQFKIPVNTQEEAQTIVSELQNGEYELVDVMGGDLSDFTALLDITA